jgi:Resolvase, N terminal domain
VPGAETYEEHATVKNTARPQLEAFLKSLREGDTFVVWRLDRLVRDLADLVRLIAELETRRIHFESLTEKIETRSPAGKLVFHVFAALAEFERNPIRERTVAGPKAARALRSKRWPPSQALAQRDQDHPGTAQNCRHLCCRDSRPLRSRPVYSVPRRPQPCGPDHPPITEGTAQSAPTSGCPVIRPERADR